MYIPASFAVSDLKRLHAFIETHSFATLVSSNDQPHASHLPLLLERNVGPNGQLIGHMARANSQWKHAAGETVLAVFHGPHAYVSPSWYDDADVVPTWNYTAVHVRGTMRLEQDHDRMREIVGRYVDEYESGFPAPWSLESAGSEFINGLLDAIVGFTIDIDQIEGKWKLSQNHSQERCERVIRNLKQQDDDNSRRIAKLMQEALDDQTTN